jgi:class 3 adenylate cyclase
VDPDGKTRYARCGDVDIAYQVVGDGPLDILMYSGSTISIECVDDEPSMARFQRRLTTFSRVIRFDRRGIGLSDRGSSSAPPSHEDWAQDALAVLDAVGSERAAIFAPFIAGMEGVILASAYAERVSHLLIVNGAARATWAPDYPAGIPQALADAASTMAGDPDAVEHGYDDLGLLAPSVASSPTFRAWWNRSGNLGATPAMARWIVQGTFAIDYRHLLPRVRVPTLILHRADIEIVSAEHGRYLAEHIPGAKYVEIPGTDVLYWAGDTAAMLDEIEEFVTGVRGGRGTERVLATLVFTDIAGSTDRAAQLGDQRWRDLLDRHDQSVRSQIGRFGGREVKTVGDGFVATFDTPGRAIEFALAVRSTLHAFDLEVRAGVHTGEIEVRGDDVAGMAVHICARVSARAGPGEILVSSTVKDSVVGSSLEFTDHGEYELKGVPGSWRLFAVTG